MVGVALLAFALPFTAGASVKKEGAWPAHDKKVDLEFDGRPAEGLKALASEADWSVVVSDAVGFGKNGANVHVKVDDEPADAVLEALFMDYDVIAHRNGKLITVRPDPAASAKHGMDEAIREITQKATEEAFSATPLPTALLVPPPVPTVRGDDRSILGGSLDIKKGEIVHSATVMGGKLNVEGTVTGDLVVMGGSAHLRPGARVVGTATVLGGNLKAEKGSRIDGDVTLAGGRLDREDGSIIGGSVVDGVHDSTDSEEPEKESATETPSGRARLTEAAHSFGQSLTKMSLLFVLGCVLLALLTPRMEKLRIEVASRPMRSFAMGLVGTVFGSVGLLVVLLILCITVIGIPVAVVGVLLAILALYGAIASVLTTFGAAVMGHRTQNPYLHLLLGCGAFLLLSSIPWVGGFVVFAVTMIAVGALIATRVGGLLERKPRSPGLV
jgi:hypothetical protein